VDRYDPPSIEGMPSCCGVCGGGANQQSQPKTVSVSPVAGASVVHVTAANLIIGLLLAAVLYVIASVVYFFFRITVGV